MQGYSRLGVYRPELKVKAKVDNNKKKQVDWVNIGLFIMLIIVLILFAFT